MSNAEGLKGKYAAPWKFLGGRYQLESSVEVVWICSGTRCFHLLLVLVVMFAIIFPFSCTEPSVKGDVQRNSGLEIMSADYEDSPVSFN